MDSNFKAKYICKAKYFFNKTIFYKMEIRNPIILIA